MGAAVAAIRFEGASAAIAAVGDARVYRLRRGAPDVSLHTGFEQLTTDDVLWLDVLTKGAPLDEVIRVRETHPTVITRALGLGGELELKVRYAVVRPGDLYLLATDGLTRQLDATEIEKILDDGRLSLTGRCTQLVEDADRRVGADNVTAVLVDCRLRASAS
jgi:serine/threonine protein phosphatase PrpC